MTGRLPIVTRVTRIVLALAIAAVPLAAAPAAWAQGARDAAPAKASGGKGKASGKASQGKGKGKGKGKAAAPAEPPRPEPGPSLDPAGEPRRCNPDGDGEGQYHVEEQDGQKVYVIDKAITVCGKVPRPLVAYVLQPRSINWELEGMKQEFLPKIRESVKKAPF